jgi:predicted amidohydrolase YtcJ
MGIVLQVLGALMILLRASSVQAAPADMVFMNGRIHTQDTMRHVVQALAIVRNDIVAAGTDAEIRLLIGSHTKIIDLRGKTALPGFIDAHTHPAESAQESDKCSLDDAPLDLPAIRARVAVCLQQNPGTPPQWFEVVQVNPSGLILSRRDLDAILADRPMLFSGSDGHTVWVNSAALRAAGISPATPDPPGGRIERDSTGNPTGTLRDNATDLALLKMPRPTIETEANRLARAFSDMRADGITSVQDASVDAHLMSIYRFLYDKRQLLMRVRGCYHLANLNADPASLIEAAKKFRATWAIDRDYLRADSVKIFADGVIEYPTQTASLLMPYLDAAGHATSNNGPSYFTQSNLNHIVALADAAGFTVHVHAIGDRATRAALDAFAFARATNGPKDNRPQIAHLELVDRNDLPRFKALGVIANLQLEWAERDDYITSATLPYIGLDRANELYSARSLRDAGALIVGGSDWNVSTFNPFVAMEHAITRAAAKGQPPLLPEQALSLQDMVDAYTIHAAYALKAEATTGSLEAGKHADLIVLDRDIFDTDPTQLHEARVLATYLDGQEVYRRQQTPW